VRNYRIRFFRWRDSLCSLSVCQVSTSDVLSVELTLTLSWARSPTVFPSNGSSFFRVCSFATPWLLSVTVHHVSNATTGTLRLLWPLTSACFKGSLRLTVAASLASLMLVVDAPRSCLDVRLPVSSLVRRLLQQRLRLELSQVDSLSLTLRAACGCLSRCCSAHRLPLSCTSALVSDPGGSPIAGLLTRCAHWSPLGQRRRQSTRKNFRGSIPRLWCSLSTVASLRSPCGQPVAGCLRYAPAHASLTTDDA